jgi:hypothetical protein
MSANVYLWESPWYYPNRLLGVYDSDHSPDRFLFRRGIALTQEQINAPSILRVNASKERVLRYDNLYNNSHIPLVNERIRNILFKLIPNDVQFFEAKVICRDGELSGYTMLNSTRMIDGIDFERSIPDYLGGDENDEKYIIGFKRLTMKPGCMDHCGLARDENDILTVFVSQHLVDIFKQAKITGVDFMIPNDYYSRFYVKV